MKKHYKSVIAFAMITAMIATTSIAAFAVVTPIPSMSRSFSARATYVPGLPAPDGSLVDDENLQISLYPTKFDCTSFTNSSSVAGACGTITVTVTTASLGNTTNVKGIVSVT